MTVTEDMQFSDNEKDDDDDDENNSISNETNASNVPKCPFDIEDFIKENSVIDSTRPNLTVLL